MADYGVAIVSAPSAVRVFAKSMYALAGGWIAAVTWLWVAEVQQHIARLGGPPPGYAMSTMGVGVIPAAVLGLIGLGIARWSGRAPEPELERREWWHGFWWSLGPNLLLALTVWLMMHS